jgi:methylmalonyl-CoA/ethylmalonyl-CoA epimerase
MKIKGIDHVGVAVKDLEAAIQFYQETLGLEVTENIDHGQGSNRGAFIRVGQVDFELLENRDPQSAIARHIEKRGEGIQHIAFEVDHLEEAMAAMKEKGIPFIDEKPRPGARDSRIVFMHPKHTHGVLMELVER